MTHKQQILPVTGLVFALAVATPSMAAPTFFTDQTSFNTATSSLTFGIEDFSTSNTGLFSSGSAFNGFSVTFSQGSGSSNMLPYIAPNPFSDAQFSPFTSSQHLGWAEDSSFANGSGTIGPTVTLTFPTPQTAVSFDFLDTDSSDAYDLQLDGVSAGNAFPPFTSFDGTTFFGVLDQTNPFSQLTFVSSTQGGFVEEFGIDNVRFNNSAMVEVPLPGTLPLYFIGIMGMLGFLRRYNKRLLSST